MSTFYRGLLHLYPASFRTQFLEEMICVFEQRARERSANGKFEFLAFFLTEISSILKGATIMWVAKILPVHRAESFSDASGETLSLAEVVSRRDAAIKNMVAAIGQHDFSNARRYSYEEARLQRLFEDMQRAALAGPGATA